MKSLTITAEQLDENYLVCVREITVIGGWRRWVTLLRIGHSETVGLARCLPPSVEIQDYFAHYIPRINSYLCCIPQYLIFLNISSANIMQTLVVHVLNYISSC